MKIDEDTLRVISEPFPLSYYPPGTPVVVALRQREETEILRLISETLVVNGVEVSKKVYDPLTP